MATTARIVDELMEEAGKSSVTVRQQVELIVGDVILEVLGQNDGRFEGLKEAKSFSVLADSKHYKLPTDFNTPRKSFIQVTSDEVFIAKCYMVEKMVVITNRADGGYIGPRQAYVDYLREGPDGRGLYLVFGDELDDTSYYEMDYYRKATTFDGDVITSKTVVKNGSRGQLPALFDNAGHFAATYARQLPGIKESPRKRATNIMFSPSKRTQRHNRNMTNIGGGG